MGKIVEDVSISLVVSEHKTGVFQIVEDLLNVCINPGRKQKKFIWMKLSIWEAFPHWDSIIWIVSTYIATNKTFNLTW